VTGFPEFPNIPPFCHHATWWVGPAWGVR
jgi:hypothetical protein